MCRTDQSVHLHAVRVYYEDTDAGGVVYHANYLKFAERARTEWLRSLGFDHQFLRSRYDQTIIVTELTVVFRSPAILDDRLIVESRLLEMRGARFFVQQQIRRSSKLLAAVRVVLATVRSNGKPVRPVLDLLKAMSAHDPQI